MYIYIHTQMCYYRFMHTYTTSAARVPIEPLASERMSIPAMAHGSQGHRSCLCGVWRCVLTQVVWQFDSDFWADGLKLRSSCLHKQAVKCWSPSGQCYAECKRLDVHANVSPKICWEDAGLKWTYGRLLSRLLSNQCPLRLCFHCLFPAKSPCRVLVQECAAMATSCAVAPDQIIQWVNFNHKYMYSA